MGSTESLWNILDLFLRGQKWSVREIFSYSTLHGKTGVISSHREGSISGLSLCVGSPLARAFWDTAVPVKWGQEGTGVDLGQEWPVGLSLPSGISRGLHWHQWSCSTKWFIKINLEAGPGPVQQRWMWWSWEQSREQRAEACHRDRFNTEIIFQKHKPEIEQCIFGMKPKPLLLVVLNTCSSSSKNALEKMSLKLLKRWGGASGSSLLACMLWMREISPRFWLIPGLLQPV